jgi:hypothetical protein
MSGRGKNVTDATSGVQASQLRIGPRVTRGFPKGTLGAKLSSGFRVINVLGRPGRKGTPPGVVKKRGRLLLSAS